MDKNLRILIAGHTGLVGSALMRHFQKQGYSNLLGVSSKEVDLRDSHATSLLISTTRPDCIVMAAAKVGGIKSNSQYPVEFLTDNISIQGNLINAAHKSNVDRFLFLGSSCIYPRDAVQPISESSLMTGPLEPTNSAYAIAKIAGIALIDSMRKEYGHNYISAMPTNLYGPNDNFDLETSHVLPALIKRFYTARENGVKSTTLWGDGSALREFLHVDDLAVACELLLNDYHETGPINVGSGSEISIKDLAGLVAELVGYTGEIEWDRSHPNGTPRKLLDSQKIRKFGWKPEISLKEGLVRTISWFEKHIVG